MTESVYALSLTFEVLQSGPFHVVGGRLQSCSSTNEWREIDSRPMSASDELATVNMGHFGLSDRILGVCFENYTFYAVMNIQPKPKAIKI